MHARRSPISPRRLGGALLIVALQVSPGLALAALASYDLAGLPRAVPTTMGALEASIGLSPPRGLAVTVERLSP